MKPKELHQKSLEQIEWQLKSILESQSTTNNLAQAMTYSSLSGGKRIRPLLTIASGLICNNSNLNLLIRVGCAFELIHCYSLIHDDLPAMDNDDLRRGQPTCHKKFGEAMAILAGDALQSLAFSLLSQPAIDLPAENKLSLINLCATASGLHGMAGGQALDIYNTNSQITLTELNLMHELKTGKLIEAAVVAGLIASSITQGSLYDQLAQIGLKIGLLFQVIDDIIDVTSTTDQLGKTANKDMHKNKATYVTLLGLENSIDYAQTLYNGIVKQLDSLPNTDFIRYLVELIYYRQK
jgi:farnesyl diphosphate synthase